MNTSVRVAQFTILFLIVLLAGGCGPFPAEADENPAGNTMRPPAPSELPTQTPLTGLDTNYGAYTSPGPSVVFAVVGDYGTEDPIAREVADLVKSWQPEFIITTGDNNHPSGSQEKIDGVIGKLFHEFIFPYQGDFGDGAEQNRFFPSMGNHDWHRPGPGPYLEYFVLPGNERYYDFTWGPLLHFFVLDSDPNEPDGVSSDSKQAAWFEQRLAESTATWKIVYFHHPPFTSGRQNPAEYMRWNFKELQVDAVLSGHFHYYERLIKRRLVYFVNGLGGEEIQEFDHPMAGSQVLYNADHGAMRVVATKAKITFQFITRTRKVIDTYVIER